MNFYGKHFRIKFPPVKFSPGLPIHIHYFLLYFSVPCGGKLSLKQSKCPRLCDCAFTKSFQSNTVVRRKREVSVSEQNVVGFIGMYGGKLRFLGLISEENAPDVCAWGTGRCHQNPGTQHGPFPHLPTPDSCPQGTLGT